jgi:hypothetical protein
VSNSDIHILFSSNEPEGVLYPKSAIGFWTAQSCGVDSGFQPRFVSHVGAVALPGRPIAILSIVFGIAEAFFARLPRQRLL